jgi:L-ascorbate metabolism protein UlaG (beta-lactamase superfamily)
MKVSLEWLGVATFRLRLDDMVVLLDTFMDRDPGAPQVGITTSQIERADYILVGHSHFDHLGGCERVARNTGAKIIGTHETVRLMRDEEVPEEQCVAVAGGERYRLSDDVMLSVFPSQHSCIWATMVAPDEPCLGDLGMTMQDRSAGLAARQARRQQSASSGERARLDAASRHPRPRGEGGALAYLIDTPEGRIFWKDTSGHWTGIMRDIRPDVALLAAGGRGNIDGEPIQGSLGQFIAREVDLLRPKRVLISHHDSYQVGQENRLDRTVDPVRDALSRQSPRVDFVNLPYLESYPLMRGV